MLPEIAAKFSKYSSTSQWNFEMSKTISPYIYKYFTIFVSIHFSEQYFETISRIREMGDSVEFDDDLVHDRD